MGFYSAIKYDIFYKANSRTARATQRYPVSRKQKQNEQTNKQTKPTEPEKEKGILSFAVEWMEVEGTMLHKAKPVWKDRFHT